jgi:DNA-binding transcriptional MerR regulator
MQTEALSIGELADAAGLSRRAIRFYVQQKLLPPPLGLGRGRHYDHRHLAQLRKVIELQQGGHSLLAIRQLLESGNRARMKQARRDSARAHDNGQSDAAPASAAATRAPTAALSAQLWTRMSVGEGIELSFDATRFNPTVEQLLMLRQLIRDTLLETP